MLNSTGLITRCNLGFLHFAHGYLASPGVQIGESRTFGTSHTVEELSKYGFRPDDRRGKANRMGNAGRMNVRAGASQPGWITYFDAG